MTRLTNNKEAGNMDSTGKGRRIETYCRNIREDWRTAEENHPDPDRKVHVEWLPGNGWLVWIDEPDVHVATNGPLDCEDCVAVLCRLMDKPEGDVLACMARSREGAPIEFRL